MNPTLCIETRRRAACRRVASVVWAAASAIGTPAGAVQEEQLKAAIVFNLLGFVDWPAAQAPPAGADLVLCVDPASPLAAPLRELAGRPVRQWKLAVRSVESSPATRCQALLVDGAARETPAALRPQPGDPVLVISDRPRQDGAPAAHVWLLLDGGRVAFELDLAQARRSGLQISSRLHRLARAVHE